MLTSIHLACWCLEQMTACLCSPKLDLRRGLKRNADTGTEQGAIYEGQLKQQCMLPTWMLCPAQSLNVMEVLGSNAQ